MKMVGNPALMQVSVEEIETHKQRNGRFLFFFFTSEICIEVCYI